MQAKNLSVLIHIRNKGDLVPSNMLEPSSNFLLWIHFVICVSWHTVLSVPCSLVDICWESADLLALLYVMFSFVFVTFPYGILGQVWYMIV